MKERHGYINRPQAFPGTAEERRANLDSHIYAGEPGDERCVNCDVRPSYISAGWPCGAEVPREDVDVRREQVRREVEQDILAYIDNDGDTENGPRIGVVVTEAEVLAEVERRIAEEDES